MVRVVIVSPLSSTTREGVEDNKSYARKCVMDCLQRGESPYASHLFFEHSELLNDHNPIHRNLGMQAGLEWGSQAHKVVIYLDRGMTKGMQMDIDFYRHHGLEIETRFLDLPKAVAK